MTADEARNLTKISIEATVELQTKDTLSKIEESCRLCQYETHMKSLHENTVKNLESLGFDVSYNKYREEYDISWKPKDEA